ncbi:MAG: AAA domain-containing protein [Bacteroidales bacterium]|nr:AAA domain-containing protein [Bacteroidales bacterium]
MKQTENISLKRLLRKTNNPYHSELDKIISFYKTILELERCKEPDVSTYYPFTLHFKGNDSSILLLDLPCNANFTKAFIDNRELTFPKDLYIGLPIIFKDKPGQVIAFSLTIDYADLKGFDPYKNLLPIRISNFTLDSRHINELELPEEKIDEIEGELAKVKSIDTLQDLVKKQFADNVELKMELQLGLCSKDIALAQISAELNRLNSDMAKRNDLLKSFLTHSEFGNQIENLSVDELVTISPLDDSQASVVVHALSNRFTVVTGAPGTGKTQVILNIIANALMNNKSVLVASKNNKAVDNVKERFDKIDSSHYLLRFGKKEYIRNQTIPALAHIQNQLNALKDQPDTLSSLLSQYSILTSKIKDAKNKLSKIEELKISIPQLSYDKSSVVTQIEKENQRFAFEYERINKMYSDVSDLEVFNLEHICLITNKIIRLRNSLQSKYSGLFKIWNNLFSLKKHTLTYLGLIENLPTFIRAELRDQNLTRSIEDFKDGETIIEHSKQVIRLLERICDWQHALNKENKRHSLSISKLRSNLATIIHKYNSQTEELEYLKKNKKNYLDSIHQSKDALINLGPQLVAAKIAEIERGQGAAQKISSYKTFLPDNIPWKDNEIPNFIHRSRDFLSICRLISVTSLSVKTGFPLVDNLFDILIIDEASQCDIASAIPLILRAKQVVIIGDPKQLKHITSVRIDEENTIREHIGLSSRPYLKYVEQSLWDYAADYLALAKQNSSPITLENHYRCHHEIISYSNHQFYSTFLDKPLKVMTDESNMTLPQQGIIMINVHGKQESDNVNVNKIEGNRAVAIAKELYSLKEEISIGIVTPFRDQADYIKSQLDDYIKENVEVNTAHGFQGDEKDVIIYSLVVTNNSPASKVNWIDYNVPNLVNVAVTRARQTLYIVGNADYIKTVSPERNALGYLIRYAQSKIQ